MLLELGRLRVSVVSVPFSAGEDGYEDGKLAASSDSHDSLEMKKVKTEQDGERCFKHKTDRQRDRPTGG